MNSERKKWNGWINKRITFKKDDEFNGVKDDNLYLILPPTNEKEAFEIPAKRKQAEDYFTWLDILVDSILKADKKNLIIALARLSLVFPKKEFYDFLHGYGVYDRAIIYHLKNPKKIEGSKFSGFAYADNRIALCYNAYRNNQSRDCKSIPENAIPLFKEGTQLLDRIKKALGKYAAEPKINKIFDQEPDEYTFPNALNFICEAENRHTKETQKQAKTKIKDLKDFKSWHVSYRNLKIIITFTDKSEIEKLCPADFGNTANNEIPKTFSNLCKILEYKDAGQVTPQQLQDINEKMKKLFDTDLRFFAKNEPMPFHIESERSKFDKRQAANLEHTKTRKKETEDSKRDEQADIDQSFENGSPPPEDEENSDYYSR